jgi:hypothetical protein
MHEAIGAPRMQNEFFVSAPGYLHRGEVQDQSATEKAGNAKFVYRFANAHSFPFG